MSATRFRKRPVEVEAMQFLGDKPSGEAVGRWMLEAGVSFLLQQLDTDLWALTIRTLEGDMLAGSGDWIVKGVAGEFYPCKPDIFEQTYEAI